ncbi:putative phytosulfokines 6 isoform X1 [Typha latifolia]|uniref:putative phytosulfokines 6 isoform X1 n=1 Tax=Typha latifolia TaxID=4733 RepID=UPI003C2B3E00
MKHTTLFIPLLFLLVILAFHAARASRSLAPPQLGTEDAKVGREGKVAVDDTWNLMGLEECEDGDEECAKRRVISEAHLDYIYTQNHGKP